MFSVHSEYLSQNSWDTYELEMVEFRVSWYMRNDATLYIYIWSLRNSVCARISIEWNRLIPTSKVDFKI